MTHSQSHSDIFKLRFSKSPEGTPNDKSSGEFVSGVTTCIKKLLLNTSTQREVLEEQNGLAMDCTHLLLMTS